MGALDRFHSPTRLGVMLSGSGTTLLNLMDHIRSGKLDAQIPIVIASKECVGAERARDLGIETIVHEGSIGSDDLDSICDEFDIDLVILAGYLRLVPISDRVRHRVINIHPALLPRFGGKGMHGMHVHRAVAYEARTNGLDRSGCTVHFADEQYDTGEHIVQLSCAIESSDTPEQIAKKVFELECEAYPRAIKKLIDCNFEQHPAE